MVSFGLHRFFYTTSRYSTGYNGVGQGKHRLAFYDGGLASLPCSYNFASFCTKSSLVDVFRRHYI